MHNRRAKSSGENVIKHIEVLGKLRRLVEQRTTADPLTGHAMRRLMFLLRPNVREFAEMLNAARDFDVSLIERHGDAIVERRRQALLDIIDHALVLH